jgi:hypothetical protein
VHTFRKLGCVVLDMLIQPCCEKLIACIPLLPLQDAKYFSSISFLNVVMYPLFAKCLTKYVRVVLKKKRLFLKNYKKCVATYPAVDAAAANPTANRKSEMMCFIFNL